MRIPNRYITQLIEIMLVKYKAMLESNGSYVGTPLQWWPEMDHGSRTMAHGTFQRTSYYEIWPRLKWWTYLGALQQASYSGRYIVFPWDLGHTGSQASLNIL